MSPITGTAKLISTAEERASRQERLLTDSILYHHRLGTNRTSYSHDFIPLVLTLLRCNRAPKHLRQLYDPDLPFDSFTDILTHCADIDINVTTAQVEYVLNDTEA